MRRFTSAATLAPALVACPRGQPPRPPLPAPPAGHIKLGSGITDGRRWTAYRYLEGNQRCVSVADETDRFDCAAQGGCGPD